jgi:threonine dehydratase
VKAHKDAGHNDYLAKILTAQVYEVAIESPLELAPLLSRRLDNRLFLKREDMQAVFSFNSVAERLT